MAGLSCLLRTNLHKQLITSVRLQTSPCIKDATTLCFTVRSNTFQNDKNLVPLQYINCRYSHSFFSRITAEELWKGVTSVSSAGRRKGRAKGLTNRIRDLNRGQVIGVGKKNMVWPGLNSPIVQGKEIVTRQELPPDETRDKRLFDLRDKIANRKRFQINPLERGWSGTKLGGRSLGPPDPIGDEKFEGFDSRVIQFRPVSHMTAQRGRFRRFCAFLVTGNKNGLAGFAKSTSLNGRSAAKSAKNTAARRLRYIERYNNHTVLHDFYCEFGAIKIFVQKKPEGYGLVCHRVLKCICEMLGIKDLHAKTEGPTRNSHCIARAFFIGLMKQKSHQQLADEMGLHVVEIQPNRDNFPVVLASPAKCRTEEEIGPTELLDFHTYVHNGRTVAPRKERKPFYWNFPSYIKEMKDREKLRNQRDVQIRQYAKYGGFKSFLTIREEEKEKQQIKDAVEAKEPSEASN